MQLLPDPPVDYWCGAIAQLGERLLCKQEVIGSIPIGSTNIAVLEVVIGSIPIGSTNLPAALPAARTTHTVFMAWPKRLVCCLKIRKKFCF